MSKPIVFENWVTEKSKDFIKGCLKVKEDERMSWEDAFTHSLCKEERRNPIKVMLEKEEDKENYVSNKKEMMRRGRFQSLPRGMHQSLRKTIMLPIIWTG